MSVTRRGFVQAAAASAVGAVAFTGCVAPGSKHEFQVQSSARLPEELLTSEEAWYASVCQQCDAGCGILARVITGRAQKVEGNPDYPVNTGRLSARGQAAVQALYHPDRLAGPQRVSGARFSGQYQALGWQDALNDLVNRLKALAGQNQAGAALLVTGPLRGHRALVAEQFAKGLGAQYATFDALDRKAPVQEALRRVFGLTALPEFDLASAGYILSFGADFLGTWLSPVHYGRGFGTFRQGRPDLRGRFVQVEPRLSQTGAAADEWIPVKPGTEGILALSIAQALVASGKANPQGLAAVAGPAGAAFFAPYDPKQTAATTGVPAEKVAAIANDLATRGPALVLGGDSAGAHTNGLFNLVAIYALNLLTGKAPIKPNPPSPLADLPAPRRTSLADWRRLVDSMNAGQVQLLLVHGANPAYGLPAALKFRDALAKVPFVVSFSSFQDETTALADLVLPDDHFLESWGDDVPDPGPGYPTLAIQQPVVNRRLDTRNTFDVLLNVAAQVGGNVQKALPWSDFKALLQDAAGQLAKQPGGSVPAAPTPEAYWVALLQRGGWWNTAGAAAAAAAPAPALPAQAPQARFAGAATDYPYFLHVYPSPALDGGEGAHLPWLQGLPDPTTTVVWTTWLELNPATARKLDVVEADIVSVESPVGAVEVPVYVYPAIEPDVVAMPLGQGHDASGRWAKDRGVNPLAILAPEVDADTGTLAWEATRVRIRKTGRSLRRLPKFEGTIDPIYLPENVPALLKQTTASGQPSAVGALGPTPGEREGA